MQKLYAIVLLAAVLLSSCSLQQRRYRSGYYISHTSPKHRVASASRVVVAGVEAPVKTPPGPADSLPVISALHKAYAASNGQMKDRVIRSDKQALCVKTFSMLPALLLKARPVKRVSTPETGSSQEPKFLREALVSLLCFLLAVGLMLFMGLLLPEEMIITFAILLSLIAIAAGMIAIIKKAEHPDKYDGVWMAVLVIILITAIAGFLILENGF